MKPITNIDDPRYVKALGHPLRVRILAILEERTASPVQLSHMLDVSIGVVSYHVRTLHKFGLLKLERTRPVRGAVEHYYRAKERPRVSAEAWATASPIAKQALLGATLQQIAEYVQQSGAAGGFDHPDAHATRTALRLDERGWQELAAACAKLLEQVARIEASAKKRLDKSDCDNIKDVGLVVMMFEALPFSKMPAVEPSSPVADGAHGSERETGGTSRHRHRRKTSTRSAGGASD